ncbi:efflux RND transporter periplasmic adaptor subunit [Undibacterium terreum]|uniref:Hemolysin secretion protein D n=1 Tax=Undibacterium terreum TaxID=1224302 RepID=A0A916V1C8_9BURK|nr:efflux RND transporter periplasmic adaptor subunit [Undibacterium terreum]GGD01434.1 hemolysin secretion protein D [Undibacterium terreum]
MEYKPKNTLAIAIAAVLGLVAAGFLFIKKDAPANNNSPAAPITPITTASASSTASSASAAASAISTTASAPASPSGAAGRPALTVTLAAPQNSSWTSTLAANGSVAAWQESIIGTELNGVRLSELLVQVGDQVKKGQLLARFSDDTIQAEVAQQSAAVAEAEATLAEAQSNARRALQLKDSGAMSVQQISQYATARNTAAARLTAAKAALQTGNLRMQHTRVVAPDDGIISSRTATIGAISIGGQELFRLIRQGRLEWRAEVTAEETAKLSSGQAVHVFSADGTVINGKLRTVAPTVDPQSRKALVYVDMAGNAAAMTNVKAGMFAKGEFVLGESSALSVPANAVVIRDGYASVFTVDANSRIKQLRVTQGRTQQGRTEILSGLQADAKVVDSGAGFLADGDTVRVVAALAPPTGSSSSGSEKSGKAKAAVK